MDQEAVWYMMPKYKPGQIIVYKNLKLRVKCVNEYFYSGLRLENPEQDYWEDRIAWVEENCKPLPVTIWTRRRYEI